MIVIGVPSKNLIPFVDKSRVKYWIIVQWVIEENLSFLNVFEAIDIETNKQFIPQYSLDERVKHAIEWIKSTSYPNEGFIHPNDKDRLKQMANTLKHFHIPFEYDAVVHYCIHHGIAYMSAIQIADHFYKAQKRKFVTLDKTDYKFLKTMLDRADWE